MSYQDSAGSSSGRTTPDKHHHHHHSSTSQQQQPQPRPIPSNSSMAGAGHPSRRSSTPAQSFLAPRLFGHTGSFSGGMTAGGDYQSGNSPPTSISGSPTFGPRRTSFGTSLGAGGRLSALSSLWNGQSSSPTAMSSTSMNSSREQSNAGGQGREGSSTPTVTSASSSPVIRPVDKPVRQGSMSTERSHFCVPDGCGGFVTIERRPDRRPSQA